MRDSIIKMGEELEKAAESEAREKESSRYYQRRMEDMKAEMDELVQRELESSRRRVELVRGCCPPGLCGPRAVVGFAAAGHLPVTCWLVWKSQDSDVLHWSLCALCLGMELAGLQVAVSSVKR